jgi:hypothetical protein
MQNRRQFIGATALGIVPTALAFQSGTLAAQASRVAAGDGDGDAAARVLKQVIADNARAYKDAKEHGTKSEHLRAASSGLRLFAAVNLDTEVRRTVAKHARAHGRDAGTIHRPDAATMARDLRRAGVAVSAEEIDRLWQRFTPSQQIVDEVTAPNFSLERHVAALAALLDGEATRVARLETGPIRRVVSLAECGKFAMELDVLQYFTAILCLSGNAPGCAAATTSILLISTAMWWAGC